MADPFARLNLFDGSPDFRAAALEPGYPLLDRANVHARLVVRWLGRFAADPERQGDAVAWFVQSDRGARPAGRACEPVGGGDLTGRLRHEFQTLRRKLNEVEPQSRTERAVLQALRENLETAADDLQHGRGEGCFFQYRDEAGRRRLVWAWGFRRVEKQPVPAAVCPAPACRNLFLQRPETGRRCPKCQTALPEPPSRTRRMFAVLTVLLLIVAAGWSGWWYLQPRAVLSGSVVSAGDQQPIAGAELRIAGHSQPILSDQAGQFRAARLPQGQARIAVAAPGFRPQQIERELAAGRDAVLRIVLEGDASLAGVVINEAGGAPLSGAEVAVLGTDLKAQTDERGRFRIEGLRGGPVEVEVSAAGFPSRRWQPEIVSGRDNELQASLIGEATLVGQVLSAANDRPISGAQVVVAGTGQSAETDADGWFVIRQAPSGPARVTISADGFASEEVARVLVAGGERSVRAQLLGAALLTGRITDAGGRPLPGAEVRVAGMRVSSRTDAQGRYTLPGIRSGPVQIEVSAGGFLTERATKTLHGGRENTFDAALRGGAAVAGTVTAADTGRPLASAEVSVVAKQKLAQQEKPQQKPPEKPQQKPPAAATVKTRADGTFRIEGIRAGTVKIQAEAAGFRTQQIERELVAGRDAELAIELEGDAVLTGTLIDAAGGTPISGARLQVEGTRLTGETDRAGRFRIEGVRSGSANIVIAADGYPEARVEQQLASGRVTSATFELAGAAVLTGRVLRIDNQQPVAGAQVALVDRPRKTTTAADGRFRFDKLPAGPLTLEVAAEGHRTRRVEQPLQKEREADVEIRLGGRAVVAGAFHDAMTGLAVAGAQVELVGGGVGGETDDSGRFQLHDAFAGPATIRVSADGYPATTVEHALEDGREVQVRVQMSGPAEARGTVLTQEGRPIAGAVVRLQGADHQCRTAEDGSFRLPGCRAGKVKLEVAAQRFDSTVIERELEAAGPTAVGAVRLTSNLALSGRLIDAVDGGPAAGVLVRIEGTEVSAASDERGRFVLKGVPARTVTLELSSDDFHDDSLTADPLDESPGLLRVLSPTLQPGQVRLVLTWGGETADLDLHLYGPRSGGRFHVWREQRRADGVTFNLDNQNGRGPETITLDNPTPGRYEVLVQSRPDPENPGQPAPTLDRSEAVLKLYRGGQQRPDEIRVAPGPEARHTVWWAAAIEIDRDGRINVIRYARSNYRDRLPGSG